MAFVMEELFNEQIRELQKAESKLIAQRDTIKEIDKLLPTDVSATLYCAERMASIPLRKSKSLYDEEEDGDIDEGKISPRKSVKSIHWRSKQNYSVSDASEKVYFFGKDESYYWQFIRPFIKYKANSTEIDITETKKTLTMESLATTIRNRVKQYPELNAANALVNKLMDFLGKDQHKLKELIDLQVALALKQ